VEQNAEGNAATSDSAPVMVEYVVRRGDTLARIASSFGVSMKAILSANPSVRSADRIFVGQRLKIPSAAPSPNATPQG
jgi:LysM repeat protein